MIQNAIKQFETVTQSYTQNQSRHLQNNKHDGVNSGISII